METSRNKVKSDFHNAGDGVLHDPIIGHNAMKNRRWTYDCDYDSGKSFSKFQSSKSISLKEILLNENPDYMEADGLDLSYIDDEVSSVFGIYHDISTNKSECIVVDYANGTDDFEIYCSNSEITKKMLSQIYKSPVHPIIHPIMALTLMDIKVMKRVADRIKTGRADFLLAGRSWNVEGSTIISLWQTEKQCEAYKSLLDDILKHMKLEHDIRFEFIDSPGELVDYFDLLKSEPKTPKLSSAQVTDLLKRQHLDPGAKRLLRALAGSSKFVDTLSQTATKLNMPLPKLKQLMTTGD